MARTHVTGNTDLNIDADAIRGALASIAAAPATPELSDVVNVSLRDKTRDDANCNRDTRSCTAIITDDNRSNINFDLNSFGETPEFDDGDLARFNQEYEPVMTYRGVSLAQSQAAGRTSDTDDGTVFHYQSYGGWLEHSVFAVQISTGGIGGNDQGILLFSYSFGRDNVNNPTADATWEGVVIGRNTETNHVVQGDAEVMFDITTPTMLDYVDFSNVIDLDDGSPVTFGNDNSGNLRFSGIPLTTGTFMQDNSADGDISYIRGRFYGTSHEEVGGVFDSHDIVGAFGATTP